MVPLPCGRLSGLRPLEPPASALLRRGKARTLPKNRHFLPKMGVGNSGFAIRGGEGADYTSVTEAAEEQGPYFPAHFGKKKWSE